MLVSKKFKYFNYGEGIRKFLVIGRPNFGIKKSIFCFHMAVNINKLDNVKEVKEIDIYRDTPVRLLGYANEVGEAFRALTPLWFVRSTYGVASAYVLLDTYDKASIINKKPESTKKTVLHAAVDTLVWQAFASVIIPGFTINRVCALSLVALAKGLPKVPLNTRKWITTAVGLGCIPFIVHPIDSLVHTTMDASIRKYLDHTDEPKNEHTK